jgi:Protein of unknown function (DUF2510)
MYGSDLGTLVLLTVIGTTIWVGIDASGRDWSAARASASSAGGWVLACLLLWIVFFPMYLAQRGRARPKGWSAPLAPTPQPPGWYADPWRTAMWRWWDGQQWTGRTG